VQGLGLGFRAQGLAHRAQDKRFTAYSLGLGIKDSGFRGIKGLGYRV
jgi:hypothetical protein